MLDRPGPRGEQTARETTERWVDGLNAALASGQAAALSELFVADSHWRNLFGISWYFATFSGNATVTAELLVRAADVRATGFRIDAAALAPRHAGVAGRDVIEAVFTFETANGPGYGAVRLLRQPDGSTKAPTFKAWTFSTSLDFDAICAARARASTESHTRDFAAPDWLEQRQASANYQTSDPDVLIIGGGHAGISVAVELNRIGLSALVIDREQRIGDNWRLRYRGLQLHNKTPLNHLRYLPFPSTFPDYIPKDKIANWLESYVDIMEVDFWTQTTFEGAAYDDATQRWSARLVRADGAGRTLRPKHIVL